MSETNQKVLENQGTEELEKELSSLDLLWKLGFDELDEWAEKFNKQDERFLEAVRNYVEKAKKNQENVITVAAQFGLELKEWEQSTREELLMTTTTLQSFFPVKSYEEINQVVEDIQNKSAQLLITPVQKLTTGQIQALDKLLETVEQYISMRKKGREKYLESVKKTTNVLYENQKLFVDVFTKQVKSAILPFQKYLKK
ncbi:hypothetical protein L1999_07440 [Neobacillus drentensis]|uniref:hypothetical protein n=1 Tax=Neobacillus drentensis TaxID=220684 RepID=UPI001F45C4E0|nr:hypothetical protein [Neobacillus drentensis]ULT58345.1 hypothetical protein L1999_07440 [Neobacillus drentensis]